MALVLLHYIIISLSSGCPFTFDVESIYQMFIDYSSFVLDILVVPLKMAVLEASLKSAFRNVNFYVFREQNSEQCGNIPLLCSL